MPHRRSRKLMAAALGAAMIIAPARPAQAEATTTDPNPTATVDARPPRPEALRLRCRGVRLNRRAAVACRWSAAHGENLAGYRLIRAGDGHRRVVARTARTGTYDTRIRRGVRYAYRVEAVNDAGRVIGRSRVVTAGVPAAGT